MSGPAVVVCSGRLDMLAAPALRARLGQVIAAESAQVVVDLGGVTFVDSSGLGALISGLKLARESGGDLRLAAAAPQVLTVLKLTTLDRVLRPHPTVEEASQAF